MYNTSTDTMAALAEIVCNHDHEIVMDTQCFHGRRNSNHNDNLQQLLGNLTLPDELILVVANQYLNPAERSRLATCNRHLRGLLPTPLRVRMVNRQGTGSLQAEFYVSEAENKNDWIDEGDSSMGKMSFKTSSSASLTNTSQHAKRKDRARNDHDTNTKFLLAFENLRYGVKYHFWTFDYQRGNKVFLGRHTRHGHKETEADDLQHMYSIGLRPQVPNQAWQITGGDDGDSVMWGQDIGLVVSGTNPKNRQPDSIEEGYLSCIPSTQTATQGSLSPSPRPLFHRWCVVGSEWGDNEQLQLMPSCSFVPGKDIQERALIVHAIPEVCDEGEYLLYSPQSQRNGQVRCEGCHVTVNFAFFVEEGIMHFHAITLPFALGIPILDTDERYDSNVNPLENLLTIKSARWGCVIYYMAVAADVSEGKKLDMDRFLRRVTDHRDHSVKHIVEKNLVRIDVKNKMVQTDAPPLEFDPEATWKFILSW